MTAGIHLSFMDAKGPLFGNKDQGYDQKYSTMNHKQQTYEKHGSRKGIPRNNITTQITLRLQIIHIYWDVVQFCIVCILMHVIGFCSTIMVIGIAITICILIARIYRYIPSQHVDYIYVAIVCDRLVLRAATAHYVRQYLLLAIYYAIQVVF